MTVFEQMDQLLPRLGTVAEARLLAGLAEGLLRDHGDMEKNLAYAALDHALADRGRLDRLYEEHQEIDGRLERARSARNLADARRLLRAALQAAREHFKYEEEHVFPVIERSLRRDALDELGNAWLRQHAAAADRTAPTVAPTASRVPA